MKTSTLYHIYNHANGNENLFRTKENYYFFIKRYIDIVSPIVDTYAYCLMPNHFHFLVKIKSEEEIVKNSNLTGFENLSGWISKKFSNFFNSYAKAYNLMYKRRGSLFVRPFKAKEVTSDEYFTTLIHYIHANPINHGFVKSIDQWEYSSYLNLLSDKETFLMREEIFDWFSGEKKFIEFHHQSIPLKIDWE